MRPLESSPKNDILIGLPSSFQSKRDWCQDKDAMQFPIYLNRLVKSLCKDEVSKSAIWDMAFIEYVVFELQSYLSCYLKRINTNAHSNNKQHRYEDLNVNEIAAQLKNLSKQEKNARIVYPHGQGKRTRRMIHLFSDLIGLRHWSEGKRKTRRIIVEK